MGIVNIEYKGVTYPGATALARAVGINSATLYGRLKMGWTIEKAVETPLIPTSELRCKAVTYRGKDYKSIAELCRALGVDWSLVRWRISDGWTLEKAVETPKTVRPLSITQSEAKEVIVEEVEYPSKKAAYKAYGVSGSAVLKRVRAGMSLENAILAAKEYKDSHGVYAYDSKEFTSKEEIDEYLGVSRGTIYRLMHDGRTLEEACEYTRVILDKTSVRLGDYPGCSWDSVHRLKLCCEGNTKLMKEWLERIYLDYPTEFHGVIYKSVEEACSALDLPVDVIRNKMLHMLSFQEAVHARYFVWEGEIYKTRPELRSAMRVSTQVMLEAARGISCNDELVERLVIHEDTVSMRLRAVLISRSNKNISATAACLNGYYIAYCATCGRPLYLTEEEAYAFKHSDEFCVSHTQSVLYVNSVRISAFRSMMNKRKNYESVIAAYNNLNHDTTSSRIKSRPDIAKVTMLLGGKYFLIRCAVCGRKVLLPLDEAREFVHSDDCIKNEWL